MSLAYAPARAFAMTAVFVIALLAHGIESAIFVYMYGHVQYVGVVVERVLNAVSCECRQHDETQLSRLRRPWCTSLRRQQELVFARNAILTSRRLGPYGKC